MQVRGKSAIQVLKAESVVSIAGLRGVVEDVWTVGGEFRWQSAEGDTDRLDSGLVGDKIDLGGWNLNFTFGFRF